MATATHHLPAVQRFTAAPDGGRLRLSTLVMIRWVAFLGQAAALSVVYFGLGYDLPYVPAMSVTMLLGGLNVAIAIMRPGSSRLGEPEALLTLGFDLLQLAVLLGLTGGLQNPFALLILAPVAVAAWTLSRARMLALAAWAALLVSVLGIWHLPLPWPDAGILLSPVYIAGVWVALVIGIFFVALYVFSIAEEAQRMSQALSAAHMALAREQQLSALGGLAAAAAHELGSPLGTIAVVAHDLAGDLPADSPLRDDIMLLQAESQRCRQILNQFIQAPQSDGGLPYRQVPLTALVEAAARGFDRDGISVDIVAAPFEESGDPPPLVERNPEILHGLGGLIQNAIQFARSRVEITLDWSDSDVVVAIGDDGPGFDPSRLSQIGEPYYSTQGRDERRDEPGSHMGLGIFISRTLLAHSGAELAFSNQESSGALVELRWPRDRIESGTMRQGETG